MVGLATALSRVLGFLRDWLIALFYGTTPAAQAFVVAFRVPNMLRDLVGEGAANSAFVPVFSRIRTLEGDSSWRALAQAVWIRILAGFVVLCAAGVWAAPWLVTWVAPGFRADPQLLQRTVELTRILFPFIGLVGMAAFFMGLLNSLHHFTLPSLGPALFNVCAIAGMLLWRPDAKGLAWGILAGGAAQLAIQMPMLRRAGVEFSLRWRSHPGARQIGRMLVPRAAGSAVYQASVLVDTIFASFAHLVGAGGIAALYFANRFLQLPFALFGISLAQVALPTLSAQAAAEDLAGVRQTFHLALRSCLAIAIPSSVGLIVLGHPIVHTLLEHGAFSARAAELTVQALGWYAAGLCSLCVAKVFVNTLYALSDTWTPVRLAAIALGLNILLNLLLIRPMGLGGLALATSLSATWNAWRLYRAIRPRIGPLPPGFGSTLGRVVVASAGMGLVAHALSRAGSGVAWMFFTVAAGAAVFLSLAAALRVPEAGRLLRWALRRG